MADHRTPVPPLPPAEQAALDAFGPPACLDPSDPPAAIPTPEIIQDQYLETLLRRRLARLTWDDCATEEEPRLHGLHLLSVVTLLGNNWSIEAIAVKVEDGMQKPVDRDAERTFDALAIAAASDGHFQTMRLPGREHDYVVFLYPGMD